MHAVVSKMILMFRIKTGTFALLAFVVHLLTNRDEEKLRLLRGRLANWLVGDEPQEEDSAYKPASAEIGLDIADTVSVGSTS